MKNTINNENAQLKYQELREEICDIGRRIWQQGWVAANDGNISIKIEENLFLVTPTGTSKGFMTPDMMILVDSSCRPLEESKWRPSSELLMHMRCYKARPDVKSVVHAHPPVATAFAVAHTPLDMYTMPEAIIALGSVPIAPYGCPSTEEIPDAVEPLLAEHDAVLLENHGALTVGQDLTTAYYRMETLEYYAKLSMNSKILGVAHELPMEKIDELLELRKRFKIPGKHPGYKKF